MFASHVIPAVAVDAASQLQNRYPSLPAARLRRATDMVSNPETIEIVSETVFIVRSQSNPLLGSYTVNITEKTCTCPDFGKNPAVPCKHRLAVAIAQVAGSIPRPAPAPAMPRVMIETIFNRFAAAWKCYQYYTDWKRTADIFSFFEAKHYAEVFLHFDAKCETSVSIDAHFALFSGDSDESITLELNQ